MPLKITNFTFMVLSYNHEKYIIEHLESIKFLILNHGQDIIFQIIINDDCSTDKTVELIEKWFLINSKLFVEINKLYNIKNIGTCSSVLNMIDLIQFEYSKMTAGDDVYSYENLFESSLLLNEHEIVSGIPLYLRDSSLSLNNFELFNFLATNAIYKNKPLVERFKGLSFNNAPNMFYSSKVLKDTDVREFVSKFDVVEDFTLQVSVSQFFNNPSLYLDKKTFVYYRRTSGSIYLVVSSRFTKDINKVYSFLQSLKNSPFSKALISNRKYLFSMRSVVLRKALNLSIYWFYIQSIFKLKSIYKDYKKLDIVKSKHQKHYEFIKNMAKNFLKEP